MLKLEDYCPINIYRLKNDWLKEMNNNSNLWDYLELNRILNIINDSDTLDETRILYLNLLPALAIEIMDTWSKENYILHKKREINSKVYPFKFVYSGRERIGSMTLVMNEDNEELATIEFKKLYPHYSWLKTFKMFEPESTAINDLKHRQEMFEKSIDMKLKEFAEETVKVIKQSIEKNLNKNNN